MTGRTLLGVWAHPDDEAYLSGGLMAEWRRRGDRVVVVTATLGEHGTDDPDAWPPHRLASLRREELVRSLRALGVEEHHLLGLPDGGCDAHDASAEIAGIVERVDPDVIVTFGPDGVTGHDDHRAISHATTAAWNASGRRAELWYATLTADFHRRWGSVNDRVGLWMDRSLAPCTPPDDLVHHRRLGEDLLDRKVEALRAHASQTGRLIRELGTARYREWWRTESFRPAVASRTLGESRDLSARIPQSSAGVLSWASPS